MALQTRRFADWYNDAGFIDITIEDTTLQIMSVDGQNMAPYAVKVVYGTRSRTYPADTPTIHDDVSGLNDFITLGSAWKGSQPWILPGGSLVVTPA